MENKDSEFIPLFYTGIDGCRGGWLVTTLDHHFQLDVHLFSSLHDATHIFESSSVICVDMPMGLIKSKDEERVCDSLIRKELSKPFSSSVFGVPCRQGVYAQDFKQANRMNRKIIGKGISIQTWNICRRIKELDVFIRNYPCYKNIFKESHPELCFKSLQGASLAYKKKTEQGIKERLGILKRCQSDIQINYKVFGSQFLKKWVSADDILDSVVLAFNARQIVLGKYTMFPSHIVFDGNNIPMNVFIGEWERQ